MLIGLRPVIEAIEAGKNFSKVFIRKGLQGDLFHDCFRLVRQNKIPFQYVPVEKLNSFTRANHQGIVALISTIPYHDITQIIPTLYEEGKVPFILVLDGITDVRNFGAITRSAEAAGVHAILVGAKKAAIVNSDAIKTSAGALNRIPVCREENLESAITYIKNSGITVFGASEKAEDLYFNHSFSGPTAFVMGAEDLGISPAILTKIDYLVKIPMIGVIASLNVSVATGILLFEAAKQRL
ncbi:MAG: 23S rRNA (guanosine(2251)-2'-O)-methyltransferase RlmB [Bacteroidales bacterium]|nr:23S rRNA (guanosine(2251)-2'-O)-methyltransferase RlmB [Bacteroidales bacterium]MBN2819256.1 23S rRNA (guanosine(2251)-2'-O)-methyltransferase RlmB [Bacteroidales bacterium]